MPDEPVHILRNGRALCGADGPTEDWPINNWWFKYEDPRVLALVTCQECRRLFGEVTKQAVDQ